MDYREKSEVRDGMRIDWDMPIPMEDGIVLRDRSKVELCEGCLRITVGTEKENQELLKALAKIG